jgi:hypothetical protein
MIISHKYKFIFIKTAKVAGTSLEMYLSDHLGKNDIFTPFTNKEEGQQPKNYKGLFNPLTEIIERRKLDRNLKRNGSLITFKDLVKMNKYFEPMPAWQVRARIPQKIWNNYYKFTIDRNPYDKVVSRFYHSKAVYEPKYKKELTIDSFLDYVEFNLANPWLNMAWGAIAPYNFPRYAHPNTGEVLVDKVCRYEKLLRELNEVFSLLKIPFEGEITYRAKGEFRKERKHYTDELNDRQRKRIERIFKKEFDLLGYKWEENFTGDI